MASSEAVTALSLFLLCLLLLLLLSLPRGMSPSPASVELDGGLDCFDDVSSRIPTSAGGEKSKTSTSEPTHAPTFVTTVLALTTLLPSPASSLSSVTITIDSIANAPRHKIAISSPRFVNPLSWLTSSPLSNALFVLDASKISTICSSVNASHREHCLSAIASSVDNFSCIFFSSSSNSSSWSNNALNRLSSSSSSSSSVTVPLPI